MAQCYSFSHDEPMKQSIISQLSSVLSTNSALALVSTVTFQNGVNGYLGTFDRYINEVSATGVDGGGVSDFALNGRNGTGRDTEGLIRFDNLFGNSPGQISSRRCASSMPNCNSPPSAARTPTPRMVPMASPLSRPISIPRPTTPATPRAIRSVAAHGMRMATQRAPSPPSAMSSPVK